MDYFILSKDERVDSFAGRHDIKPLEKNNLLRDKLTPLMLRITNDGDKLYPDIITTEKINLVSDKLKQILEKYDKNIFFRPLVFQDIKNKKQSVYWVAVFEDIDCLSEETEFHKDGKLKRLVVDKEKVEGYRIFTVKGMLENYIIISLDLAESLLRRDFLGLKIKRIS